MSRFPRLFSLFKRSLRIVWSFTKFGCAYYVVTQYGAEVVYCSGSSMEPTISSGDFVFAEHISVMMRQIKINDLVICRSPSNAEQLVCKRVKALEGDLLHEGFFTHSAVPKGHVWLEGDNKDNSNDSREYGPVPYALLRAKIGWTSTMFGETCGTPNADRLKLYKQTTPPFKEAMRQRCADRIKQSRSRLLERYRFGSCSSVSAAQEIVDQEWASVKRELEPQEHEFYTKLYEEIKDELVAEEEEQIFKELSVQTDFDQAAMNQQIESHLTTVVVCPVCQKNELKRVDNFLRCACGVEIRVKSSFTFEQLHSRLQSLLSDHTARCEDSPLFFVENCGENFVMLCQKCELLTLV